MHRLFMSFLFRRVYVVCGCLNIRLSLLLTTMNTQEGSSLGSTASDIVANIQQLIVRINVEQFIILLMRYMQTDSHYWIWHVLCWYLQGDFTGHLRWCNLHFHSYPRWWFYGYTRTCSNNSHNEKSNLTKTKARRVKSMLIIFFDIKGTVYKEFDQQSIQSIPHCTVKFCSGYMKMCECPKLWQ